MYIYIYIPKYISAPVTSILELAGSHIRYLTICVQPISLDALYCMPIQATHGFLPYGVVGNCTIHGAYGIRLFPNVSDIHHDMLFAGGERPRKQRWDRHHEGSQRGMTSATRKILLNLEDFGLCNLQ